jgi:hypothetical protein
MRLSGAAELRRLLDDEGARLLRAEGAAEELVDRAEVDRQREDLAAVLRVDAVHVRGERAEAVHVRPHALVRRVEQVRAVPVDLDPRVRVALAVRVAADVVAPVDDRHVQPVGVRHPLRDRQPEESRSDNQKVRHAHPSLMPRPL